MKSFPFERHNLTVLLVIPLIEISRDPAEHGRYVWTQRLSSAHHPNDKDCWGVAVDERPKGTS